MTQLIETVKFYIGLTKVAIRLIRKEAKLFVDPITKEILILDPIAQETWVLG